MATENFTKLENLDKNSEIESQVTEELTNLDISVKEFYEVNQDKVNFKTEVVKEYFNKLKDDANIKWKTSKESWQYLVSDNKRFTTCIMAMQIALESMWYEIQKIDWRLWKNTKAGIKRFQTQCDLSLKDGLPGQETIVKLCEALEDPGAFEAKQQFKPSTVKASASASASASDSGGTSEKHWSSSSSSSGVEETNGWSWNADEVYSGNLKDPDVKKAYVSEIKNNFASSLKTSIGEDVALTETGSLQLKSDGEYSKIEYFQELDLVKCVDKNWNVDETKTKKELSDAIKKLVRRKKTGILLNYIRKEYGGQGHWGKYYISAEVLKLDEKSMLEDKSLNPEMRWKINKYFNKFDYYWIEADYTGTSADFDAWKIKIELDDDGWNEVYNKWMNNEDLIVDVDEIMDDKYVIHTDNFYSKIRKAIINIVKREDFK